MAQEIVLGPRDEQGYTVWVTKGYDTAKTDGYYNEFVSYRLIGVEEVNSRTPETDTEAHGGFVDVTFANGKEIQILGSIERIFYE